MAETALRAGADCIVTRKLADFAKAPLLVLSPKEFLQKVLHE